MAYKNPILAEIYVELHLQGEGLGSSFVELVPHLKELGLALVELAPIKHLSINAINENADPQITRGNVPRLRIWNNEKSKLVQLSKNQIAMNLVGRYPGWATFRELFDSVILLLKKSSKFSIESILLGTIDRVAVPSASFKIDDYLNVQGGIVPLYFKGSVEAADVIIGRGVAKQNGSNRQFHISWLPKGTQFEISIQSKLQNSMTPSDKISDVLEQLHEEAVLDFEKMITDKMRNEVMGGK